MIDKKAKKKAERIGAASPMELAFRGFGSEAKNSIKRDVIEGGGKDFLSQLINFDPTPGPRQSPESSEKKQGPLTLKDPETGAIEVFNAANLRPDEVAEKQREGRERKKAGGEGANRDAAINHGSEIRRSGEKHLSQEQQTDLQKMQQLQSELRQQAAKVDHSAKMRLAPHTIQDASRNANKQRITFFEGLVKGATMDSKKVADSGLWKATLKGKKGGYDPSNGMQHSTGEKTTIQNSAG